MRVPLSWLAEHVDLPAGATPREVADALVRVGLEVESVEQTGGDVSGPVVVGRVLSVEVLTEFKKPIRFCRVETGERDRAGEPREIVCGAPNVVAGAHVVVALPGSVLPGGFAIASRKTYGRISDGMICSARELGLGDDHTGILVLPPDTPVGADAAEVLGLRDAVLDIAVTPDRGYALSIRGVAREAAAALGVAFRDPAPAPALPADAPAGHAVRIDDATGCTRYVARQVHGLDPNAPSPLWLRRRLLLAGMRPISLAVDVTNHVMLDLGQPLHAFDAALLSGPIVVRRAQTGETLRTLDGSTRPLDEDDLLICDDSGPIALAGVMGGETTEVTAATTNILIEAAHFVPEVIARAARRHKLPSESSRRFERGVDDDLQAAAAQAAVDLLVALGGAVDDGTVTDVDVRAPRTPITLPVARVSALAGRAYSDDVVRARLIEVGCTVEVDGDGVWLVRAPSWRPDLDQPADLVEEVARLEGYDTIPALLPVVPPGRGLTDAQRGRRRVGRALAHAGITEVLTYPFVSAQVLADLGFTADDVESRTVRLANPISEEEPFLRTTLLPGLFGALLRNVGRGARDVALFEVGQVYRPRPDAGPAPRLRVDRRPSDDEVAEMLAAIPDQPRHVAAVLSGQAERSGWWGEGRVTSWADAVDTARVVADALGVAVTVRAAVRAPWHPGRCAAVLVGDRVVGHAGELHPRVVATLGLPSRTCAVELDLDALGVAGVATAPAVSSFPVATQDVALIVADGVAAAEVEAALRTGAGPLLEDVRLFDVYAGAQLGEGVRSLAFTLRFRAPDRTLTVEETTAARNAAVDAAARATGAALRGV